MGRSCSSSTAAARSSVRAHSFISCRGASCSGADVGRPHARCVSRAYEPGRSDMGCRTCGPASRAGTQSVVGRVAACGATRAHVGFAGAGALTFSAASGTIVGSAQARGSSTGRFASGAVMGRACRSIVGRASDHRQDSRRCVV
jgi:hypothetical protein